MANTTNTAKFIVDNQQALLGLSALQDKTAKVSDTFGRLKGAIAGLAVASFVADAFRSANALTDMAKAANISTQALLGFRDAVKYNGGAADAAVDSMGKFSQAIEGAANGSVELQDKFLQLGISLQDLRNLSEEQLLQRVVEGLGKGTAGANTMAVAMAFFGKSFRSVDFKGVAADIQSTTAAAKDAAAGYIAAGEAEQRFSNSVGKLQTELIKALLPISELAAGILEMSETVGKFIKIAVQIGLVIASFTLLGKVISWGRVLFLAAADGIATIGTAMGIVTNFFRNFALVAETTFSGGFFSGFRVIGALLKQVGEWALKSIPGLGALGGAMLVLYDNAIKPLIEGLGKLTGLWGENDKAVDESAAKAKKAAEEKARAEAQAAREIQDALQKQILAIRGASDEFNKQNKKILDNINLENALIGATKEYSDVLKAQEEIFKRAADESDKLRDAKEKLSKEEKRRGLGEEYDKQIKKIGELAEADAKRVESALKNANRIEMADKLRLFGIQNQIDKENQLQTIQDNIAKSTMTELEKKYYDIEQAAKRSAKAAIEAEEARIGRPLNLAEREQYDKKALEGIQKLRDAEKEAYDISRDFRTGWKNAFQEYVDNATNAAQQASRIFQKATQGMEDMIVDFAKTGKFEWKGFVNSMLEELLRSQVRQLMAQIFNIGGSRGNVGGSGGLLGGFASILGFANGGVIPTNAPVLVGERGPELISGAAGRNVTPNEGLGGTNITYNINAVDAMSFKQLVAADPAFIYAVTQQGAKSIPQTRR